MELSMWIIKDWLKDYEPADNIKNGARIIKNVRLFSDAQEIAPNTIYIDHFSRNKIICTCGNDFITVNSGDLNGIFNRILDAFDYYNEWEQHMSDMIYDGCSLSALLKVGHENIHNYLAVADSTFLIRDGYGTDEDVQKNQDYFEAFQRKLLPVDVLNKFNEDARLRMLNIPPYLLEIPSMKKTDIVSNIIVNNIHKGWVICMRSDNTYEPVTFDLLDAFTKYVNLWYRFHSQEEQFMDKSSLILEILENSYTDKSPIKHRLEAMNWYENDDKIIYVIKRGVNPQSSATVVKKHSEQIFFGSFALEYRDDILLVVNLSLCKEDSESLLYSLLKTSGAYAGKSAIFKDIFEISKYYETAMIAADHADGNDIQDFWNTVLPYFKSLVGANSPISLIHPQLRTLQNYDSEHGTHLTDTLRIFLENNCSYTATASAMYIHRSTLLYRLEKINSLTHLNLEQYDLRMHLQLSYLLL